MIRKAKTQDINDIAELIYIIWQDMELEIIKKYDKSKVIQAIIQSQIDVHYRTHLSHIWVYETEGEVAGIVIAYDGAHEQQYEAEWLNLKLSDTMSLQTQTPLPVMEADVSDIYLDSVATFPKFRGRGIATQLLRTVISTDTERTWALNCDFDNHRALKLYQKLGFSIHSYKTLYHHKYYYMTYSA